MMRLRLFPTLSAIFIGLPLLDALVLILLGRYMGFWTTLALVLLSGFGGAWLAKSQGLRVWREIQREFAAGQVPTQGLLDGVIILVAGGMLAAPGFLTDILGLSLLLPPVRVPLKRFLRSRIERAISERVITYHTYDVSPPWRPEPSLRDEH